MTSTTASPASNWRRRLPRFAARPLARRKSASRGDSAGYLPGSVSQTRTACLAAASWASRYRYEESLPFSRHRAVSSASRSRRIMLP